jgi:hypothetical protein
MEHKQQRLSISEAKEIDLVQYLSSLGHEPTKVRRDDYWYLSPLRNEKTPSFKVNRKLNRWYDHGLGQGGNLVDFGIEYHHCTIKELLNQLSGRFFFQRPTVAHPELVIKPEQGIKLLEEIPLTSPVLLNYLRQRHIPVEMAEKYCREVRYELNGKTYYGIGFRNDSGGYEIRNPYFKGSSSPKDITTIKGGSDEASIFEGFIDFLSFKTMHQGLAENSQDFVVLNSVSFFEKARPFMEEHKSIRLYLDRDTTGENYTRRALSMSERYSDESKRYKKHKDLNDWLVNLNKPRRKQLRQKLK